MEKPKKIPYALTNFERIRTENYLYVDKTRFIEMLEDESTVYHYLLRPHKFGKSLFLSVLEHYYDLRFKDRFKELFGDLYIGQNPTKKANSYFVLRFNFSGLGDPNDESFKLWFTSAIKSSIMDFLTEHKSEIKQVETLIPELNRLHDVSALMGFVFNIILRYDKKAFVIIDDYDFYVNDVTAKGCPSPALPNREGENQYRESNWVNSAIRSFYLSLKTGTGTVVYRILATGVSLIILNDPISGFNIMSDISHYRQYNEILGLTRTEVEWVMDQIQLDKSLITVDMEQMYDGYLFNKNAENKIFNSAMILNYLQELLVS